MDEAQSWTLIDQGEEVALFIEMESKGPWIIGNLMPFPGFEERRDFFEGTMASRVDDPNSDRIGHIIEQNRRDFQRRQTQLKPTDDSKPVSGFALFIVGNRAWIRR